MAVYTSSLKLSWIRRFFQSNVEWQSPMNHILKRHPFLWDTGTKKHILQDPHNNPFCSCSDTLNEPIWYNNDEILVFPYFRNKKSGATLCATLNVELITHLFCEISDFYSVIINFKLKNT